MITRRLQILFALVLVMTLGTASAAVGQQNNALQATGRTVDNIDVLGQGGEQFTGRIVNLDFAETDGDTVLATGRLIGWVTDADGNTERVNERFSSLLTILDNDNEATQILFLELGPIFLDVLGLVVEVPDPIILEIRAERGPGQLLGNLLVGLLGALD